jgi:TP901 family phage tail tape measure protein
MMASSKYKIVITGDGSAAVKELDKVGDESDRTSGRLAGLSTKATLVGTALVAAAGAFAVSSVKAFAAFETQMNEVFTLLPDISEQAMDAMSDQVKDFSKEFGVLPEEVVPALYQSLSAGIPKENVFTFMETAQKLAKGGASDLETSVDGLTSAVNAYGEETLEASRAADIMFTTVRFGKTNIDEIASSIFNVAPVAASLGVTFEEVGAAIAAITLTGTPTSVATTQIRAALGELGQDSSKVAKTFKDLTGKSFPAFIEGGGDLQGALAILTEEADKNNTSIKNLFGSNEAGSAAMAIAVTKADAYSDTMVEMANSAGAAEGAFAQMDQGAQASMEKAAASFEVLKLEAGEALAPILEKLMPQLAEWMTKISDEYVPRFLDGWRKLQLGFDELERRMDIFVTRFKDGWDKISTFVTTAVTNFGRGISRIAKFFSDLKGDFNAGVDAIKKAVDDVVDFITGIPGRIGSVGSSIASAISDGFKSAWNTVADTINNLIPNEIRLPMGRSIDLPDNPLPRFHNGGRAGTEQVALLQAGEVVYTAAQNRAGMAPGGGGPSITVNINGPVGDPSEAGRQIVAVVERYLDSGGSARFAA